MACINRRMQIATGNLGPRERAFKNIKKSVYFNDLMESGSFLEVLREIMKRASHAQIRAEHLSITNLMLPPCQTSGQQDLLCHIHLLLSTPWVCWRRYELN
jgi:hypothetical protein